MVESEQHIAAPAQVYLGELCQLSCQVDYSFVGDRVAVA